MFYWPSKRSKFVALVGFRTLPGEGIIFDPQVSQAPLMMAMAVTWSSAIFAITKTSAVRTESSRRCLFFCFLWKEMDVCVVEELLDLYSVSMMGSSSCFFLDF